MRFGKRVGYKLGLILLILIVSSLYIYLQAKTIYGGDAGDFASAIVVSGIAHPPGYPLYTLLGIIFTKLITFGTVAWRIGFLSSVPAIFTVVIIYGLIYYLTKRTSISLISALSLAFVYPFWLYSEVVEVFSLNNLFLVAILWSMMHWYKEAKVKYLYLASFLFGLSLSHHHIILFMVPAFLYLLVKQRKKLTIKILVKLFLLMLVGLTPYLYIVFTAYKNVAPINWMGSLTWTNFFDLVTRARYGTFQSGGFTARDPLLRLLNILAFFKFAYQDFRLPAVLLIFLGGFQLFKAQRKIFITLFLGFAGYLFFLYLASFPLVDNFIVATFERFTLPLYVILAFFLAAGFVEIEIFLQKIFSVITRNKPKNFYRNLIISVFLLYPAGLFLLNYPKISSLKNDFTAENFGRDILASLPKDSVLFLTTDTPLFDTQYVYYAQKDRPDVKLIHFTSLFNSDDLKRLMRIYPDLDFPDPATDTKEILKIFLAKNFPHFPIYSKLVLETNAGSWIPYGLVFRFELDGSSLPLDASVISENEKLWGIYHIPQSGNVAYQNLMISDIIPSYATAHQEIGFWAAKRKYSDLAEKHLLAAEKLYPQDLDSYIILAQSYIVENKCQEASDQIDQVTKRNRDDVRIYYLQAINYAACFKDPEKAAYFEKLYQEKKNEAKTPLKEL